MKAALLVMALLGQTEIPETLYQKPILTIGLDDSWESDLLHKELTRDWTKINPDVWKTLSDEQRAKTIEFGKKMNAISTSLRERFNIEFMKLEIGNDLYHRGKGGRFPKYKIRKNGQWQDFPEQTFLRQTWPLKVVKYIHDTWFETELKDQATKEYYKEVTRIGKLRKKLFNETNSYLKEKFPKYKYFLHYRERLSLKAWDILEEKWVVIAKPIPENELEFSKLKKATIDNPRYSRIWIVNGGLSKIKGVPAQKAPSEIGYNVKTEEIPLDKIPKKFLEPAIESTPLIHIKPRLPWIKPSLEICKDDSPC